MKFRNIVLAVATIAALSPVICNASAESVPLKACANAFAASITSPGVASGDFKLAYHGNLGITPTFSTPEYTFVLEAHNKAGTPFARARCLADSKGTVTSISAVPLNAKYDLLASEF